MYNVATRLAQDTVMNQKHAVEETKLCEVNGAKTGAPLAQVPGQGNEHHVGAVPSNTTAAQGSRSPIFAK